MSAKFTLEGSSSGAVKAIEQANDALTKTGKAAEGAAKSTRQLNAEAQRIRESLDPQEKLNRKLSELRQHVDAGRLSYDQASRAAKKFRDDIHDIGKAGGDAFGGPATSQILSYVAGLGSITAVVGAITSAFQDAEAASQAAADSIFDSLGAFVELQQLGQKDFARGAAISQNLVRSGVVKPGNRAQATEIASNLINAEFSDQEIDFITNDLAKIVNANNLTSVGGDLKKISRSFGEGDIENLSDRVLAAANITQADLAQTSREVLKFSQLAASSGVGADQALAAFVVSEGLSASPEAAAEAQKSLFSQIKRRGLAGDDLFATLDNIQRQIPKGGTAFDVLGDANAVIGFENLQGNRQRLKEVQAIIQAAGGSVSASGDLMASDPSLNAARLRARAEGRSSVATENASSEAENLFAAMRAELDARGTANGEWAITRWLRNQDLNAADTAGIEADAMRAELQQGFLTGSRLSPELTSSIEEYLKRIAESSEKTQQDQKSRINTRPE
jgi:hypothetical protein